MTVTAVATADQGTRTTFRPATFGDVLRSEWTKLRSVRSTFWALTVAVVLGHRPRGSHQRRRRPRLRQEQRLRQAELGPDRYQHLRAGHRQPGHRRARCALHQLGVLVRE